MLTIRVERGTSVDFYLKRDRTEDVYNALDRGEHCALYLFLRGWYRVERYHTIQHLPHQHAELHWRSPPQTFDIWEQSQLIHVTVGKSTLQCYVTSPDTPIQYIYDAAKRWATANGVACAHNSLFDRQTDQLLDHTQLLLDIYTRTFEIR